MPEMTIVLVPEMTIVLVVHVSRALVLVFAFDAWCFDSDCCLASYWHRRDDQSLFCSLARLRHCLHYRVRGRGQCHGQCRVADLGISGSLTNTARLGGYRNCTGTRWVDNV